MHTIRLRIGMVLLWLLTGTAFGREPVTVKREDGQAVRLMAYGAGDDVCRGIAVISHGVGGSERGYAYLGEAMASLGYLAVVVGHRESGREALRDLRRAKGLRDALATLVTDPRAYAARLMDIAAAKQWAQRQCRGRASILLGHSMGAATAMMEAGAANRLGIRGTDAFGIYVLLSPQGSGAIFPPDAWGRIVKPVLMLTGTRDASFGGGAWETRTEAFRAMPPGCKWLAVIDGATHLNFAGLGFSRETEAVSVWTIRMFLRGVQREECSLPPPAKGVRFWAR